MCCLALGVNSVNCYLDNVCRCEQCELLFRQLQCELCELLFRQGVVLGVNCANCYLDNVLSYV